MRRRKIDEINAGSMADIAFLLLIFFLVTTTMEIDAGIGRVLPLDVENPPPRDFNARNVLEINVNSNDDLMVEGSLITMTELKDQVLEFYTANREMNNQNENMPNYTQINLNKCQEELGEIKRSLEQNPNDRFLQEELEKWEQKRLFCLSLPSNSYQEIHKSAVIQLKNQAGTSYGTYLEIQNILKEVVNELRSEICVQMNWGNYYDLNEHNPVDQAIIQKLRILVPERIVEPRINN